MNLMRSTICLLCVTFAVFSARGVFAQKSNHSISVKIVQSGRLSEKGLLLHWMIVNDSSKPVVIYSTFLYGPAVDHRVSVQGGAELFTSLIEHSEVDVNAYPKAKFIKLSPGESIQGDFKDSPLSESWVSAGMKICLDVAYGADDAIVRRAIAEQAMNPHGGHPANPIVDWQQICQSDQIVLR
jgi:hypothetical protein